MQRSSTWTASVLAALLAGGFCPASLPAQDPPPRTPIQQSQPTTTAPVLPTIPYADYTFGFEMRLPADWSYDRTRFAGPDGSIGLIRGRDAVGRRTLQLLVYRGERPEPFAQWLERFELRLTEASGVLQVRPVPREIAGRTAVGLEVDGRLGVDETRTHYFCVPFDDTLVWVLTFAGSATGDEPRRQIDDAFEFVAGSLRVLYDPQKLEQAAAAFEHGRVLIERLRGSAAGIQIDDRERYYEVAVKGQPIGYLRCRASHERRALDDPRHGGKHKDGLRVSELSWRFGDDGSAQCARVDMFVSFDLRSELIETQVTQVPPRESVGERVLITLDQCVREEDTLFSSFTTNLQRVLPDPRQPIKVGPGYLPLAWVRLLPGLVGGDCGELHAFAVYDAVTRALVTHTIVPLGPRAAAGSAGATTYAFETREGFVGQPGTVFTDARGNVVRFEAGDQVTTPSDVSAVGQRYEARRAEAERRIAGRAP